MLDDIIFVLELIGTFAFATSGSMVAIKNRMDMFGVIALGVTTSVGGGILRDIILGKIPPTAFVDPIFVIEAIIVSILIFSKKVRHAFKSNAIIFRNVFVLMDNIGLAVFTVVGVSIAIEYIGYTNYFLLVIVGLFTAVGGGVMRDIMANNVPFIFIKDFYATASLVGAISCVVLWKVLGEVPSMILSILLIMVLRYMAKKRKWKLPVPRI